MKPTHSNKLAVICHLKAMLFPVDGDNSSSMKMDVAVILITSRHAPNDHTIHALIQAARAKRPSMRTAIDNIYDKQMGKETSLFLNECVVLTSDLETDETLSMDIRTEFENIVTNIEYMKGICTSELLPFKLACTNCGGETEYSDSIYTCKSCGTKHDAVGDVI
jgi:hypothetical protein